jgi:hypothetical protein
MSITGRFFRTVVYAGAAAAATYFFDPERGPDRRAKARDQLDDWLRQAEDSEVQRIPGVDRVIDLLHTPGEPAPDEAEASSQASPPAGSTIE